nr:hypothetical protein [Pseudomonas sp.]
MIKPSRPTRERAARKEVALEAIRNDWRTIIEIANQMGIRKPMAHEYLNELAADGLAEKVIFPVPSGYLGIAKFKAVEGAVLSLEAEYAKASANRARTFIPQPVVVESVMPDLYMRAMVAYGREHRV